MTPEQKAALGGSLRVQRALADLLAERCELEAATLDGHFDDRRSLRLDAVTLAIEAVQAVFRACAAPTTR